MRLIELVPLARLFSVGAVVSTPTRRVAILALLVAWVARIREAGVATIGAAIHGTVATATWCGTTCTLLHLTTAASSTPPLPGAMVLCLELKLWI